MTPLALDALLRGDWPDILFERAVRAYFQRFGAHADQPSASSSEFHGPNLFALGNARGELARYRVTFTGTGPNVEARLCFVETRSVRTGEEAPR
jgi:hypothetical protein